MNWRAWVYDLLSSDLELTAEVPASRMFSSGSLTQPPDAWPFIVITFMPSTPAIKGSKLERIQTWVHDTGGSYVRIDRVLRIIQNRFEEAGSSGDFIAADWEGDSNDLRDDAMRTNTRYAMFRIAATRSGS